MAVGYHGDSHYSWQGWVRVNLCAVAGVQSRLNTIEQRVCQDGWGLGLGAVSDVELLGSVRGQELEDSVRLKFDSRD